MSEQQAPPRFTRGQVYGTLQRVFGFASFRPLQEDVIRQMLHGRDCLVVMPTGGGKSLCYQLPALLLNGLTVVVSPLIALMKDQVDALRATGVAATFINSSISAHEVWERQQAVCAAQVKLLYVAPERLLMTSFLEFLLQQQLARLVVDEAHCISEWGHDFRPEYRELRRVRELCPGLPIGAFTATATERVRQDIIAQLSLRNHEAFVGSFNRPNLFYEVRPKERAFSLLIQFLNERKGKSGIVYCQSRAGADTLAQDLLANGHSAVSYHAGLETAERTRRQELFKRDDVAIIVATIAFGMGIDKPDIRFVVHYDLPKNMESYYQETGRAGRDGLPSDCLLFYSYADVAKIEHFIKEITSEFERRIAHEQLCRMVEYAESCTCRRGLLLDHFGEELGADNCGNCDNCRDPADQVDVTLPAQQFLSCVKRTGEMFGANYIIGVLRGSKEARILRNRHDQLSTYGIGADRSQQEWQHLARQFLQQGLLRRTDEFGSLTVTAAGNAVLFRNEPVQAALPRKAATRAEGTVDGRDGLFQRLRALRKQIADEQGVPPYVVFHDSVLIALSQRLPRTLDDLGRIPGIGERKRAAYGETFLAEIAAYAAEHPEAQATDPEPAVESRPSRRSKTVDDTMELVRQGMDLKKIASLRGLTFDTITEHVEKAMLAGQDVPLDRFVSPERQRRIVDAFEQCGTGLLRPAMDLLGEGYSYGELRLVRAAMRLKAAGGSLSVT